MCTGSTLSRWDKGAGEQTSWVAAHTVAGSALAVGRRRRCGLLRASQAVHGFAPLALAKAAAGLAGTALLATLGTGIGLLVVQGRPLGVILGCESSVQSRCRGGRCGVAC